MDHVVTWMEDSVSRDFYEKELSEETEKLLDCLNEQDRKLFLDLYVKEMEIEDVARDSGLKREVVYNRISRGKRKIKKG